MPTMRSKKNPNKNLRRRLNKGVDVTAEEIESAYWEAAEKYPGPAFTRGGYSEFLGGIPSPRRLANMDAKGKGPDGGYYDGRIKKYLKIPAVKWAIRRAIEQSGIGV